MAYTLEEFCKDTRIVLARDDGPAGREQVARHLERLLADAEFVARYLGPDQPSGSVNLYEDPDFGFIVRAHTNRASSDNSPHCHGPSWVIYGMAVNHVDMTEWKRVDDGAKDGYAELEIAEQYTLHPGEARVYNVGAIHSLDRPLPTRLIRVQGCDLDKTVRYRYRPEQNAVKVLAPSDR